MKERSFARKNCVNAKMAHAAMQTPSALADLPVGTQPPPFLPSPAPWGSTWEVLLGPTTLVVAAESTDAGDVG